jgi:hypothetical protein
MKVADHMVAVQIGAPDPWLADRDALRRQLLSDAMNDFTEHFEDLERNGPDYLRACVEAVVNGRRMPRTHDLRSEFQAAIRELVLDIDVAHRRAA